MQKIKITLKTLVKVQSLIKKEDNVISILINRKYFADDRIEIVTKSNVFWFCTSYFFKYFFRFTFIFYICFPTYQVHWTPPPKKNVAS